jgi:predicted Ser/Thr protein kinase
VINISKEYFGVSIKKCKFLGKGYEGRVYLTPQMEALKIFKDKRKCKDEYDLLKKVEGSKFFPKALQINENYMLREYVPGTPLENYIKKNGLSRKLSLSLINLIEEFERLGFTRLDITARHIYVQSDEDVRVIDPRKCYIKEVPFPELMLSDLERIHHLDNFLKILVQERPNLAVKWFKGLNSY